MIRCAKIPEINDILHVTKACASFLIANGIYQWSKHYPSATTFEKDIKRGELYILEEAEKIIGTIVLSTLIDDEYLPVQWLTPNSNNLYIHRLSVHPNHQGKGCAQKLMAFAENYAIENNFTSIRLDTFSQNKRNQTFYKTRGYQKLGVIFFLKQSEHPFHCYELVL